MERILLIICLLIPAGLFAQTEMPVIRAGSDETLIFEEGDTEGRDWYLAPDARPDVYELDKTTDRKWVTLRTDQDSIRLSLAPGESQDFLVLLNGKDTCWNRFVNKLPNTQFRDQSPVTHDTIPFELTPFNNVKMKTRVDGKEELDLKFDSGALGLVLTHDILLDNKKRFEAGETTVNLLEKGAVHSLQLGNEKWDQQLIWPTRLSGQGTVGRFGWDLFDWRVLEIDFDNERFIIHSRLDEIPEGYTRFEIDYEREGFCLHGTLTIGGKEQPCKFLVDNGYQRAVLLDAALMREEGFSEDLTVIKTNELRDGQGNVIKTQIVNGDLLQFGELSLANVPVQILDQPNPAGFKVHFLGGEVLKRFNTIFDFQNGYIYLQPNHLLAETYADGIAAKDNDE